MRSALVADPFSGGARITYRLAAAWAPTGHLDRPVVISLRNAFLAQLAAKDVCEKRVR
jgi:hypothetical protein